MHAKRVVEATLADYEHEFSSSRWGARGKKLFVHHGICLSCARTIRLSAKHAGRETAKKNPYFSSHVLSEEQSGKKR